ncbi:MAG: LPXTG cell wall anchor domain-containing protein [Acidimicrobiales bacterium]|jgi:LPXTG-motif cell wall-anchored protein
MVERNGNFKKTSIAVVGAGVLVGALAMLSGVSGAEQSGSDVAIQVEDETSCGSNISVVGGQLVSWAPTNSVVTNIPVGTYSVIAVSTDGTHGPGVAIDQVAEKWSFTTNTGLVSGVTADLPELDTSISTGMGTFAVTSPITSITFNHQGDGASPNSVYPSIVFSCVEPEPVATAPTTAPPTTATQVIAAPTTVAPTTAAPSVASNNTNNGNSGTLPETGGSTDLVLVAAGLIAAGGAALVMSRHVHLELVEG